VTSQQFEDVRSELRKIVRLMTLLVTKDLNQKDKIALLSTTGLQPKEIADLIGTTPNTVSVTLVQIRKEQAGRRPGRGITRGNEGT
jgi:DNA-binding CsgD family transcriptional regulator